MTSRRALEHISNADLPEIVESLRDAIGWSATITLVDLYGGTLLFVPSEFRPDHELIQHLGHRTVVRLVEEFAGERIYMPRLTAQVRAQRDAEIRQRYQAGWTARKLAREYGLSDRHVWRILEDNADDRQASLL